MSPDDIIVCANCGKGGEGDNDMKLKTCTACKLVKYCSRECQIAHRPQHKKDCKKRAKDLHEEALFKQPPPLDDCPICFLRMPSLGSGKVYMACCGKLICRGCIYAVALENDDQLCPFCRTPAPTTDKEVVEIHKKRMEMKDPMAISSLGGFYANGSYGLPQNYAKALELYKRAAELDNAGAYYNIGNSYSDGIGVERDMKKARHYWELAAMRGQVMARNNLGAHSLNLDRALKHWNIAVEGGNKDSLENIKRFYMKGGTTKDDYTTALGKYQEFVDDIRSAQRDGAAAFSDEYKYY